MITRVAVISIWAEDIPTCAHFYRDVLGLRLLPHHGSQPHFEIDGTFLTIRKGKPSPVRENSHDRFPLLAFTVEDLDRAVERLRNHGVEMPWGIEAGSGTRWVMFHDPAGNLIELAQFEGG